MGEMASPRIYYSNLSSSEMASSELYRRDRSGFEDFGEVIRSGFRESGDGDK